MVRQSSPGSLLVARLGGCKTPWPIVEEPREPRSREREPVPTATGGEISADSRSGSHRSWLQHAAQGPGGRPMNGPGGSPTLAEGVLLFRKPQGHVGYVHPNRIHGSLFEDVRGERRHRIGDVDGRHQPIPWRLSCAPAPTSAPAHLACRKAPAAAAPPSQPPAVRRGQRRRGCWPCA